MPTSSADDDSRHRAGATNDTQRLYLESLAGQLTGWSNPRERVTQALERDEFILYTQTILPLAPGAIPACEFLVRLKEEEQHLAPPGAFIPVMEYYDLMPELDRWVVSHVLDWYRTRMHERQMLCSINLSGSTVRDSGFPIFVHGELERYGVPGRALCFEIAEHDVTARVAPRSRFAARLKAFGCRFAIGSFGRDGVSFDSLKRLPADLIKIDGGIVREVARDPVAFAKAQSIKRVGDALGIQTVAECVETSEILDKMRELAVHYVQGFGISQPVPLAQTA